MKFKLVKATNGLCIALLAGCTGAVVSSPAGDDDPASDPGSAGESGGGGQGEGGAAVGPESVRFACQTDVDQPAATLQRLTRRQYTNTLLDLCTWALGSRDEANAVIKELAPQLAEIPSDVKAVTSDDPHGGYRRLDQSVQQSHAESYYELGTALGRALASGSRLLRVAGACATDSDTANDNTCLKTFLERFAARAVRGPLPADSQALLSKVFTTSWGADAWADVIAVLVNTPHFLYMVEHGNALVSKTTYRLTPFELAARLSYHFTDSLPDDELWGAAVAGKLAEAGDIDVQVKRLAKDPRFRGVMADFYSDWLKVEDLKALDANAGDVVYKSFAGKDLPKSSLRQSMIDDVLGLTSHYTFDVEGKAADLLTSDLSFAKTPDLAGIYRVTPWDGKAAPPALSTDRPGLLTRALFLTTGTANTRPIMKGVFIRKMILCDEIPPPPQNANASVPSLQPGMTTREVVEELTEKQGTICASCHAGLINPLGFITEGFDSLGRQRSEEKFFDAAGKEMQRKVVRTQVVPRITDDDERVAQTPNDVAKFIVESGKFEACMARNYTRFTMRRQEDTMTDGCRLERARGKLAGGGSLADFAQDVALSRDFAQRSF